MGEPQIGHASICDVKEMYGNEVMYRSDACYKSTSLSVFYFLKKGMPRMEMVRFFFLITFL